MKKILFFAMAALLPHLLPAQIVDWVRVYRGGSDAIATDLLTDPQGNVYTVGYSSDTTDFNLYFGLPYLVDCRVNSSFLTKVDSSGQLIWAKIWNQANSNGRISKIRRDSKGNLYLAGQVSGTGFDLNPSPLPADTSYGYERWAASLFFIKLDSAGDFVWGRNLPYLNDLELADMDVDSAGNMYILGDWEGIADLDPGPDTLHSEATGFNPGDRDGFVLKLDSLGNLDWINVYNPEQGFMQSMELDAIATLPNGNLVVAGAISGNLDLDLSPTNAQMINGNGTGDGFILQLNSSGEYLRHGNYFSSNASSQVRISDLETSATNKIFACGAYNVGAANDVIDLDPSTSVFPLPNGGWENIFVTSLDSSLNFQWAKGFPSIGANTEHFYSHELALSEGDSSIVVTGYFNRDLVLEMDSLYQFSLNAYRITSTPLGPLLDIFLLKLNSLGNLTGAQKMGNSANDEGLAVDIGPGNYVYSAGLSRGSFKFKNGIHHIGASPWVAKEGFQQKLHLDSLVLDTIFLTNREEALPKIDLAIFPNPCNGPVHIEWGRTPPKWRGWIYNLQGQIVQEIGGENERKVDFHLPREKGIYLLRLDVHGHAPITRKIVRI